MMHDTPLIVFTLHYPYSKVSETFFDPEIEVLSKRFKRVIIVPWKKEVERRRAIPHNVEVSDILLNLELHKNYLQLYLRRIRHLGLFTKIYLYSIFHDKPFRPYLFSAYYLYNLINSFERSLVLRKFIESNNLNGAIFYDYWFENSTLSLAILKQRKVINKFFSRSHGFDVFDDRWSSGLVPFRSYKLKNMDKHFTISEYNKRYFHQHINKDLRTRIEVSYLGVHKGQPVSKDIAINRDAPYTIVSCANLLEFKQVHLMPALLNSINLPITWYHFGDGPIRDLLLLNAAGLNKDIELKFMGHVDHDEMMDFYRNTRVDLFISLSLKEGLPVSMMEALSFGIPLVGHRIFGIPEIINDATGLLFEVSDDFEFMAMKIRDFLLKEKVDDDVLMQIFEKKFYAENNYNMLVDLMTLNSNK